MVVPMDMDGYNEEDNMRDNYTEDYFDKRKGVSFIMNLKEIYRIREVYMLMFVMLHIVVHIHIIYSQCMYYTFMFIL